MRVVAGELRGRRLRAPRESVRPTADRVREALFAILGDVTGLVVLDLFSGTGAVAIEAISRGAARATLVDTDPAAARANVAALGLEERCRVVGGDAIRFLRRDRGRYDLIYLDPPYRLARRLVSELEDLVPARLADGGLAIVESASADPIELGLPTLDRRDYGATAIRIQGVPR
ncbi:MAG: 16S rRNA (guanine(966)-N(2))-methyltransferase RsmD [Acidobacteria bacterium]|nr:MAG: 16S rRNA (guanine(966)-N(2))-methyltransferase RsmD [Acidobacteriota bacterium]MCL4287145.1 RsmD family RNA methyltransferase [Thermoleophilia bacterium]GIK78287.1 MAG: methyltransferase small [Actinomycetes bacterium]